MKSALKLLTAAALLAGLALQTVLYAQGALVVSVPEPYTDTGIPFASPRAAAVTTPSPPHAWGGPRTGQEATLSERVADYAIEATLDPVRHTVDGTQRLTWRNRSARAVRTVYLHLYLNAFEHDHTTFNTERRRAGDDVDDGPQDRGHIRLNSATQHGQAIEWRFVQPDEGPASDRTVVRFDLPQTVEAGASTTLDIAFRSQLPRLQARSGHHGSFHLVAQWFPKIGVLELPGERGATAPRWNVHEYHAQSEFYADFGHYDVKLTAPKDYTVGATGELQGAPVEKNGMLTHHYVQGDVHDFAWTADKRTAPPLTGTWTPPASASAPASTTISTPVSIRVLYPPEFAASAAPSLQAARDALSYFAATLGPYPYKTLTIVIPPHNAEGAAGMEYPTFYTAESYTRVEPDTMTGYDIDFVNIHEFGHNYFQGILASNEFEEPLLDEGVNEWWNLRMLAARGQRVHPAPRWLRALGVSPGFDMFAYERAGAPRGEPADPLGQNTWARLQGIGPVYTRGALMLHDLEAQLGKQATEQAMRAYYARWRFRHPSVADLRESLAESTGQRALVERVFAQQVYGTDKVDDRISDIRSEREPPPPDGAHADKANALVKAADLYRTTVTVRRRGAAVPQTLRVTFADGSSETVRWDVDGSGEQWKRFVWTRPVRAVSAELDPDRRHLLDTSKLDDSRTVQRDGGAARRWAADLAALAQLALALLATI